MRTAITSQTPFGRKAYPTGFEGFYGLLDDFLGGEATRIEGFKLDLKENDDEYGVEAELPGIKKSEVKLSLDSGTLTITAHREAESDTSENGYVHRERHCSEMIRRVHLPEAAESGVKAKLTDGILTVTIPKLKKEITSKDILID
ncbi:MAG: Hsp20/alpha crystallin family protein [Oscillospiraceae bacterium]|jgi:HSP20 family protein|nr:Hsp20/alpha crystallin family protein [Oscillospiraceae bacterium]